MKKCKKGITLILVAAMMMSQTVYGQEISPTTSGVFESVADNQSAEETMEVDADGEDVAEETEISEKIITEAVETEEKLATENETFVDGGLTYQVNDDGESCTVVSYDNSVDKDLIVPDSVNGLAVTGVAEKAFYNCTKLESIQLPTGIKKIQAHTFEGCENLENLVIPGNVESISDYAFYNCKGLVSVVFSEGVRYIYSYAFGNCGSLRIVGLPKSISSIWDDAFKGCSDIEVSYDGFEKNKEEINLVDETLKNATWYCRTSDGGSCGENLKWSITDDGVLKIYGSGKMTDYSSLNQSPPWYDYHYDVTTIEIAEGVAYLSRNSFQDMSFVKKIYFNTDMMKNEQAHQVFSITSSKDCELIIGDSVTKIAPHLFERAIGIKKITFDNPQKCTEIGEYAFADCYNVEELVMPEGVTSIGAHAFDGCSAITKLTIPSGTAAIGDYAFDNCTELLLLFETKVLPSELGDHWSGDAAVCVDPVRFGTTDYGQEYWVDKDNTVHVWKYKGEAKEVIIPSQIEGMPVVKIEPNSFSGQSITSVTIPETITEIGRSAFAACVKLEEIHYNAVSLKDLEKTNFAFYRVGRNSEVNVIFGARVERIPANLFVPYDDSGNWGRYDKEDCTPALKSVTFEENSVCKSIGQKAFGYCETLEKIVIPESIVEFGKDAFYVCTGLETAGPAGGGYNYEFEWTEEIPDYAFSDYVISYAGKELNSITLPDTIQRIGAHAFEETYTTDLTLPESVTEIGEYAFANCRNFNVALPDGISEIGEGAFYNSENIDIQFPASLTVIKDKVYGKHSGSSIEIPENIKSIGDESFGNFSEITISKNLTHIGKTFTSGLRTIHYNGTEKDREKMTYPSSWDKVEWNYSEEHDDEKDYDESVRFFEKWDAETQTAYFGKMDLLGSRVGEESDTSFINDVDKLVGHYVLVETKKRDDNLVDSDTLISIRPVDSKIGIVESVDSNKIVIGDETYSSSEGLDDFVDYEGEEVLYHVCEGKLKEIEILQTGTGELTYWNTDNRKIKIKSEGYLSSLADAETIKFLGKTKFTNVSVQYTYDDLGFIYHVSDYVPSGEVSYYDTYVPPTKEESILLKYAAEWNKAYDNYVQALKDAFDKMAGMDEEKKEAIITAEAQRMQKNDKESSSKYLTGNLGQYSLYAYKGLAEFFYDNTSTKMGVGISDVSGTFSGAQLVNNILKACYNSSKEYDYDNVKVSISVFTAGSARFGDLKYTVYDKNGKQIEQRTVAVCSTIEECEASIKSYVDELKDLATTSAYNVASAVYTDILGKPLSTLSKDYLNKTAGIIERRLAVSLSEKFKVAGVGDIIKDLDECYTYYTWITKTINQGKYDNIVDATKNITSLEFKDTTIKDAAAKKAYSVLKSATNKLTKKCEGYIAGTVTGDSKCAFKVKFKCPVNVEVYNSDGEKIGYVDETDVWYTDDLEITDLGGAKEVCILNGDLPTFKVTSYDYGKLDCTIEEYNENYEPVSRLNYYDIDLNTQSEFEIVMKNDLASNKENLAITSDGNEIYADECVSVDDKAGVEVICTPTTDDGSEGGEISGAGMYIRGDEVVLSANTYEGYYFTGWYQGEELLSVDSSYEFTAREDADIEARFIHDEFIYIQAEAEDGGYVIGSGRYLIGEKAVLTAVPDENAIFMGWYNGDEKVSDDAEYEFDVSEDITLTAHFKPQETLEKVELIKAADTGKAEIEVSWKAVEGAEGYRIYRKFTGGNWKQLAEVEADQLSYVDSSGVTGKLYSYTVQAFKMADGKEIAGEYDKTGVSATKLPAAVVLKEAKSNEKDGIDISWNKVSNADGYRVYRKENGGSWARIADIESNTKVMYTDKTANTGRTYYYTVRAYKVYEGNAVLGGYDNHGVTAVFKDTIKTLETVVLDKTADSGKGSIIVSWKAVNGAEGYRIYKKFAGSSWQRVTNVTADQLSYDDGSGVTGKTYIYTVRAFKHVDGKEVLGGFDSKGLTATKLPAKVTLREAKDNGKGGITVSWNKVSTATGYRVYRKEAGGSWKGLGNVASNATTTYTDQNVTAGKSYVYTIRAYKEYEGKSYFGDYDKTGKTAVVTSLQEIVKLLAATAESGRKITVTWKKAGNCDGYILYRKSGSGSWSRLTKITDKNVSSYTDGSGTAGTTYTYTVRAYKTINGKEAMGGFDSKGVSAKCKN
mgnify:CR=1 FL=1